MIPDKRREYASFKLVLWEGQMSATPPMER